MHISERKTITIHKTLNSEQLRTTTEKKLNLKVHHMLQLTSIQHSIPLVF